MADKYRVVGYDDETGEVFRDTEVSADTHSVRAIAKSSVKSFEKLQIPKFKTKVLYSKVYDKVFMDVVGALTPTESHVLCAIIACPKSIDKCEIYNESGEFANNVYLANKCHMREDSTSKALTSLVNKGILYRERQGKSYMYYGNPYIFQCGYRIDFKPKAIFDKTVWRKYHD